MPCSKRLVEPVPMKRNYKREKRRRSSNHCLSIPISSGRLPMTPHFRHCTISSPSHPPFSSEGSGQYRSGDPNGTLLPKWKQPTRPPRHVSPRCGSRAWNRLISRSPYLPGHNWQTGLHHKTSHCISRPRSQSLASRIARMSSASSRTALLLLRVAATIPSRASGLTP